MLGRIYSRATMAAATLRRTLTTTPSGSPSAPHASGSQATAPAPPGAPPAPLATLSASEAALATVAAAAPGSPWCQRILRGVFGISVLFSGVVVGLGGVYKLLWEEDVRDRANKFTKELREQTSRAAKKKPLPCDVVSLPKLGGYATSLSYRLADDPRSAFSSDVRAEAWRIMEAFRTVTKFGKETPRLVDAESGHLTVRTRVIRDVSVGVMFSAGVMLCLSSMNFCSAVSVFPAPWASSRLRLHPRPHSV